MTVYRATEAMNVYVKKLGRDVPLSPSKDLDDTFPEDEAIIKEWAPRGLVREVNPRSATKTRK